MATSAPTKAIATCLILAIAMQMCGGSAIPIWEFLTRNEKMSHLYSTFAQLVSVHCKATAASSAIPVNQCKHNLLSYGYEKLQTFTDAQLDAFDPYQRGANELIWSSIMRDHPSATLITTRKPLPTPPASSIVILTHQSPLKVPTQPTAAGSSSTPGSQQYANNPLFDIDADQKHKYAMDMDMAYGYPALPSLHTTPNYHHANTAATQHNQKTYLTGPLVFRVRPDGTPVEEDKYRPLPIDDDLEVFHVSSGSVNTASPRPNKHRKIATISALKQQHQQRMALQQPLLPPHAEPRNRRNFQVLTQPAHLPTPSGYYYGRVQA